MPAKFLAGTVHADALLAELEPLARKLSPTLVIIQVGNDAASSSYIKRKLAACEKIGIKSRHLALNQTTSVDALIQTIKELNAENEVTGYIIQLPLPEPLWQQFSAITDAIDPAKDVDGFTASNFGAMALRGGEEFLPPATAAGVVHLLEAERIPISGKHVVIVGRSNLVGKPLALMLLNRDATVTICHSKTENLAEMTRTADILVSAVGKPGLITGNMVKEGAVVVDIGITNQNGKLVGDVDFDSVSEIASAITPVPGGVGPLTVACLLKNVMEAKH